jgi:hypothetical protein
LLLVTTKRMKRLLRTGLSKYKAKHQLQKPKLIAQW